MKPRKYVPTPVGGKTIAAKKKHHEHGLVKAGGDSHLSFQRVDEKKVLSKFSAINIATHKG